MGFLRRKSKPAPPPPAPPAPAIQPPAATKKGAQGEKGGDKTATATVKTAPTIQTTARGITSDAPLQYASLMGQNRRNNGMMQ